jgi:hypothetical protein
MYGWSVITCLRYSSTPTTGAPVPRSGPSLSYLSAAHACACVRAGVWRAGGGQQAVAVAARDGRVWRATAACTPSPPPPHTHTHGCDGTRRASRPTHAAHHAMYSAGPAQNCPGRAGCRQPVCGVSCGGGGAGSPAGSSACSVRNRNMLITLDRPPCACACVIVFVIVIVLGGWVGGWVGDGGVQAGACWRVCEGRATRGYVRKTHAPPRQPMHTITGSSARRPTWFQ